MTTAVALLSFRPRVAHGDAVCDLCGGLVDRHNHAREVVATLPSPFAEYEATNRLVEGQTREGPRVLIVAHGECLDAVPTATTHDLLHLRDTPRGLRVDPGGAVSLIYGGVRYRVTGSHRTDVVQSVKDALRIHGSGNPTMPVVDFVRTQLKNHPTLGPYIGDINEVTTPPTPAVFVEGAGKVVTQADTEPRYTLNIHTRDPHMSRADMGSASIQYHFTSQGPPTQWTYTGKPLSPKQSDNQSDNPYLRGVDTGAASGRVLPSPGTVTDAMLPELDTPEQLASRPAVALALLDGLKRAHPRLGIVSVNVDRDPVLLDEVATVHLNRRVRDMTTDRIAYDLLQTLRSRAPSWTKLEDMGGVRLKVVDDNPGPSTVQSGTELDDEVEMRGLPVWPRALMTPRHAGGKVRFRGPLISEVLGLDIGTSTEARAFLAPFEAELIRVRARWRVFLGDNPGEATIEAAQHGVLEGFDPVTNHACVKVTLPAVTLVTAHASTDLSIKTTTKNVPERSFFVHCHPSWLIEWNVPPGPVPPQPTFGNSKTPEKDVLDALLNATKRRP